MPFNASTGVYTPPAGAEDAFPGQVIASATWNAIFTDISEALTILGEISVNQPVVKTTAGPFAITTETFIVLNKGAPSATGFTLPAVSGRNGQALRVLDWAGNAGDITFTPNGAETIEGKATWAVGSTGGAGFGGDITLVPITALSGWAVL